MINFGPATITRENLNLLTNCDFDLWSNGPSLAPDNWTLAGTGALITRESTIIKESLYSANVTRVGNNCWIYQQFHSTKGLAYWKGKTITAGCWVYATVATRVRIDIFCGSNDYYSSYHTGSGTWEWLTVTATVPASATLVGIYLLVQNGNTSGYFSKVICVEGVALSYNIGKSFGGGSINTKEIKTIGMTSKNQTSVIIGGEGILHAFQWNNTISIKNNSTLFDYGKVKIINNQINIVFECCRLYLGGTIPFGEQKQSPLDIYFTFKKSLINGNIMSVY